MFEQQKERASNAGPLFLIAGVCLTIVATAGYVIHEAGKGMSNAEARQAVTSMVAQRGPATVHFRTGLITPISSEKTSSARYQLLERAGVLAEAKRDNGVEVTLTDRGQQLVQSIAGTSHSKNADGTEDYIVPLATREVVDLNQVKVLSPSSANIRYTWKWNATAMGDVFDLAGKYADGLNVWERDALAKDGADLFHRGAVVDEYNTNRGWQIASN